MEEIRQTTWDVWNTVNNGINYLSTRAVFLPSTVYTTSWDAILVLFRLQNLQPNGYAYGVKWAPDLRFSRERALQNTGSLTHRIHGTGICTYMNGWFLWKSRWIDQSHGSYGNATLSNSVSTDAGFRPSVSWTSFQKTSWCYFVEKSSL